MGFTLPKVVMVNQAKCLNCYACITACPVKYCNNATGDFVSINADLCLACGKCITACTHKARSYIDDFGMFFQNVLSGEKHIAICTPSVVTGFPNQFLKLNTLLKEIGIDAIFDSGIGAELTLESYKDFIKENNPQTIISGTCPAIVTYIELYKPELIKYLAPFDSPVLHTIKMIREFYPRYRDHKIAVISPCNALKRELSVTGLGDYNVAQKSIFDFLKENNIDLDDFHETDYENPVSRNGFIFSNPGGLTETIKNQVQEVEDNHRIISENPAIYNYLETLQDMVDSEMFPFLIDCLNCESGCNSGPLSVGKNKPTEEIEFYVRERKKQLIKRESAQSNTKAETENVSKVSLQGLRKNDLYKRSYTDMSENMYIKFPNSKELKEIYRSMHKFSDKDIKNCSSCGYGSCFSMAVAIKNKLNKPNNCYYFLKIEEGISSDELEKKEKKFNNVINTSIEGFAEFNLENIFIDVNPAMKDILNEEMLPGKSLFDFVDEENRRIIEKQMSNMQNTAKATFEIEFICSDAEKKYCLVNTFPKYNFSTRAITGSYALISDISRIKIVENALINLNANLEEKVRERTFELSTSLEKVRFQQEEIISINEALEYERLNHIESLEYAKRIQDAVLKNVRLNLIKDIFVLFYPKDVVSGDFYFIKNFLNYSIIAAADSTGHGVPGALMSILGMSILETIFRSHYQRGKKTVMTASNILNSMRRNLIKTLNQTNSTVDTKDGMDMALCIINNDTLELQYAGAFNPLIFIRDCKLSVIQADRMPIGIYSDALKQGKFKNNIIQLQKNDTFYIFSDGFQDQFGEKNGRKFMKRNLRNLLYEIHQEPMEKQKEILIEAFYQHKGSIAQTDDIVLIGFKY